MNTRSQQCNMEKKYGMVRKNQTETPAILRGKKDKM